MSADSQPFQHGDKVKCLLDTDVLREMQEGHGGWNPRMAEVSRPAVEPCVPCPPSPPPSQPSAPPQPLPPPASSPTQPQLHDPPQFIGQTGTVHRITDRGDVRVQFNHETRWTFHPGALTKVPGGLGCASSACFCNPFHVPPWPWGVRQD